MRLPLASLYLSNTNTEFGTSLRDFNQVEELLRGQEDVLSALQNTVLFGDGYYAPALSAMHEQEHYRQITSTPFGYLHWLIAHSRFQAIILLTDTVAYDDNLPRVDIIGHGRIDSIENMEVIANTSITPMQQFVKRKSLLDEIHAYTDYIEFVEDRKEFTVGEFKHCFQDALNFALNRAGINRWFELTTRLDESAEFWEVCDVTLTQLMEASARLAESDIFGHDKEQREAWEYKYCRGDYGRLYYELEDKFLTTKAARAFLDLTLTLPGITDNEQQTNVLLEDIFPPLLYTENFDKTASNWFTDNSLDVAELTRQTSFTDPKKQFELFLNIATSHSEKWGQQRHTPPVLSELLEVGYLSFYRQMDRRFGYHFSMRMLHGFMHTTSYAECMRFAGAEYQHMLRPLVEVYNDDVMLFLGHENEYITGDALVSFLGMKSTSLINSMCMTILYGKNIEWSNQKMSIIQHRFSQHAGLHPDLKENMESILRITSPEILSQQVFSAHLAQLLCIRYDWS